jgi:hypothetical protein
MVEVVPTGITTPEPVTNNKDEWWRPQQQQQQQQQEDDRSSIIISILQRRSGREAKMHASSMDAHVVLMRHLGRERAADEKDRTPALHANLRDDHANLRDDHANLREPHHD